ncbi:MAG: 16S rRNA (adenine(1518)-N(6)/adenine(1519)-N(6))-dimethyltransferase RsmA [Clostridia bacterium]|nr:16S rRNA (adenine(1518)-N(6)/adenine(1519)-N(6))-dimethyltransferase RsmA [Clostridia bacterium]
MNEKDRLPALTDERYLRQLISRHGFRFDKRLGQNFIVDPTVCPAIADSLGDVSDCGVLEIGPGVGVLTRELSRRAKKVVSVEADATLLPILSETLEGCSNVEVVYGDALELDLAKLVDESFGGMRAMVAANIPYSITSPLVVRLLETATPFCDGKRRLESLTLMLEKETAARLASPVGTREAGAVSAAVEYYSEPEILFGVPASSFMPAPKVDSVVARFRVREERAVFPQDEKKLFRLIKACYAQRRKTAANSLSSALGVPRDTVATALGSIGAPPDVRAEQLTLAQLCELSRSVGK